MFEVHPQLPKMNPYPQDNSIIVLDNCAIHKSEVLREVVTANGQLIIFLPPYSPDYNPIEESFSCGGYSYRRVDQFTDLEQSRLGFGAIGLACNMPSTLKLLFLKRRMQ